MYAANPMPFVVVLKNSGALAHAATGRCSAGLRLEVIAAVMMRRSNEATER